ncbi:MAG: hypothetical protein CL920_19030 [Deltaproteobacteria bacterium]|nr:hypothetical protein [Deltaproteobacteria bacterium]MBU50780.1 hypothetical protein [Deltaproteobacteria bacterium]
MREHRGVWGENPRRGWVANPLCQAERGSKVRASGNLPQKSDSKGKWQLAPKEWQLAPKERQ